MSVRDAASRVAKFDLTVAWDEATLDHGELRGVVEYDVDLFDRATVERMMAHYVTLLESALAAPDTRVTHLAMVPDDGLADLASVPESPAPRTVTLPELFDAAVVRWANRPALVQDGRTQSYAELATQSDRVCAYLRGARRARRRHRRPSRSTAISRGRPRCSGS